MSPRKSEAAQVEALRAGDSQAFERLYSDYSAPIYNLCARVVCDREEAKDLTQDVFIAAFKQLRDPAAEPVRKLKPWLYRVATNACYNHLRARKHLGGGDAELENASCAVDEYQRAETVALVEASLGQLNERYRTALVLKDLQGLEPAEIAEVMEVSRPNADVLVHRARASFKAAFAKLGGDVPAPAALGAVLLPLSLPAALQAMPSFAHPAAPPAHAPAPHTPIGHGGHLPSLSHVGPAGAGGLLTKIGAALTTKIGITAAAATLVIGGTVAVKEVQHAHAHPWKSSPGHAWQAPASRWSKQWARWSLYGHWMKHGWPMGWDSGRWSWNGRMGGWSWNMDSGSKWSSGGMMSGSSSWGGGTWTMSMSRSGSSGWSSGGKWSGSGSGSKMSGSGGSWSGKNSGSSSSGSWKGSGGSGSGSGSSSGSGSGSSGSWGGSSGGMSNSGSSGGSWGGSGGGSSW
jgi:RNA polymerase sigma factor (sigma-70 family)